MNRVVDWLTFVARKLWPGFDDLDEANRQYAILTVAIFAYGLPLAIAGLVGLALSTELAVIHGHWLPLLILLVLAILFEFFPFYTTVEITPGSYISTVMKIDIVVWSAALIFGPTALWLDVVGILVQTVRRWWPRTEADERLDPLRELIIDLASGIGPRLIALSLYTRWGGSTPMQGWEVAAILPAFYVTLIQLALGFLVQVPLMILFAPVLISASKGVSPLQMLIRAIGLWYGLIFIFDPAAILVAGLYSQSGPEVYFFFIASALAGSIAGSRLSSAAERNRQRTRELEQIERLGRSILAAPLDGSALPELISDHLPGMFSYSRVEVQFFSGQTAIRQPADWVGVDPSVWEWLKANPETHSFPAGGAAPWCEGPLMRGTLIIPIFELDEGKSVGGLYVARRADRGTIDDVLPAAQSFVAQIASALHSAGVYKETLDHQRAIQELAVAGRIQASFLPDSVPELKGWQVSAMLEPARETSGDFYDLIPMWDGRLGIVVADVADKGMGAALYMALSRTLIRTYATEYSTRHSKNYAYHPERVLNTVNQCILQDTSSDLFVTVFYGIIDPATFTLTYANAGHNPPFVFSPTRTDPDNPTAQALGITGIPLGIFPDMTWARGSVQLRRGDVVVLYTDGITEAENDQHEFFGGSLLLETVQANLKRTAQEIQQAVSARVRTFVSDAPQVDDLTLLVVKRQD